MNPYRRGMLHLLAAAAASTATASVASSAATTRIVVGFPPGGPLDIAGRFAADFLTDRFGRAFVVENLIGESGNAATGRVASAAADGRTLLLCGPVNAINSTLFPGLSFDFARDLTAVSGLYKVPLVVEVHPGVPARTASEFIALAKGASRLLRVGYAGKGTPQHIGIELFKGMTAVDLTLVPYQGSAPALEDLLGGRLDAMFDPLPSSIGHIRAGRLRPLALTGSQRVAQLRDVPLMQDTVPGYEAGSWFGLCAPRGTPVATVEALNAACNAALDDPAIVARIEEMGGAPMRGSAETFSAFINAETAKYARVIREAGIELVPASSSSRSRP